MNQKFGDYIIERKVAVGGMAEIYKARDSSAMPLAIKKVLPNLASQEKFIQMFLDEIRIVTQLTHPNIVQLYDFGLIDGAYYYTMEWIEGHTLAQIMIMQKNTGLAMPVDVAILMVIDMCDGLHYAHDKKDRFLRPLNIVHRDLSPPNIMVTQEGVFKITDFGIAKVRDKNLQTQPGVIRGKFSYMSPEQSLGGHLDARSDLFSLGVILYELITLKRLFLRKTEAQTLDAVRLCKVPPLKESRNDIPYELEKILKKLLTPKKENRFSNAMELKDAFHVIMEKYYPETTRMDVVDYLKGLFPDSSYVLKTMVGMDSLAYRGRKKTKNINPTHTPWRDLMDHPYLTSLIWCATTLVFAEMIVYFFRVQ